MSDFALAHPGVSHLLMMGTGRERNPDRFDGYGGMAETGLAPLVADVRAAMDAGRIARRDPERVAMVLWAGVHGIASLLVSLPGYPWPPRDTLIRAKLDAQEASLHAEPIAASAW